MCPPPTILCRKVAVRLANVLPLAGGWVQDLHVGREVLVAPEGAEVVEGLVGDIRQVELMVAFSGSIR